MKLRPTVVLASGQLLTAESWAPQITALACDFDVRLADHGRDATIADMAERLLAESPERFDLVAHAMGGFVAFEIMRRAPERLRSVVLIATLAEADGPAQTERRQGYIRLVEAGRFAEVVEERIPILVHPARREDEALLAVVRRMALQTGPQTFLNQQKAIMGRIDSRPALAAFAGPVLLLRGEADAITSAAHQDQMLAALPKARLVRLAHAGHLATLEKPASVNALLADWLCGRREPLPQEL